MALCVLMGLGSLTAGCAIAKAVTLEGVFNHDYTFGLTKPAICTILEHLCGMILASLPALRTMFGSFLGGNASRRVSSGRPSGRGTPPWWGTRAMPIFESRTSWIGKKGPLFDKKEKGTFSGSEDTTVVATPPLTTKGVHRTCRTCGGTGIHPIGEVSNAVSWDHRTEVELSENAEGWPLRSLSAEKVGGTAPC